MHINMEQTNGSLSLVFSGRTLIGSNIAPHSVDRCRTLIGQNISPHSIGVWDGGRGVSARQPRDRCLDPHLTDRSPATACYLLL